MDFLVELFFEIIVTVYAELMGMIIPEEKSNNKTVRMIIAVFAVIIMLGLIVMALFGMYFAVNDRPVLGWCLIIGSIMLSIAQITIGLILKSRKEKK